MDLANITKKRPKMDKIEQEIVKSAQRPDPKTFSVHKSQIAKSKDLFCQFSKVTKRKGDGKLITCWECEGPLRGGFCLFSNSKAENSFTYDPDSFNDTSSNFNHLSQPQLCGNDSHYGYDCPPQFPLVYKQELSYNQNYNEDTNELFQKLLEDLQIINKELEKYINSPSWNRSTFFNDCEEHSIQYKEYLENSSNAIAASNFNQEKEGPPQDSDIRQLVREEYGIKVREKQKQNMEDNLLELLKVCRQKVFYCMHNDVDDVIESALNSKLLLINLRSQRLDKKKQEVKNIVEQSTKYGSRIAESFQNFRVKKSSTSLNNTSQISSVNAIAPVLPTEEPEYSLSRGYEHLSTILETESDEVIESSVKNLVQIPSEYEVTSDDKSDHFLMRNVPMENFNVYSNPLFDDAKSDLIESLSNHDTLFDYAPLFDNLEEFSGELMPTNIVDEKQIKREHEEYIILMEKLFTINSFPRPLENFHANTINETLPTSPIQEDGDLFREEIDIYTGTDDLMPPGIESDDYDSEGEIHFLEELLSDDSISLLENESSNFNHHDDPLFPRPPPKPSDVEFFFDFEPNSGEVISVVINNIDELNEDECFDTGGEIDVFANIKDDDYFPFIFVI
nr:hypothetical protein [Tanacetum cinerariifolium]